jgi:hypothetical protein
MKSDPNFHLNFKELQSVYGRSSYQKLPYRKYPNKNSDTESLYAGKTGSEFTRQSNEKFD